MTHKEFGIKINELLEEFTGESAVAFLLGYEVFEGGRRGLCLRTNILPEDILKAYAEMGEALKCGDVDAVKLYRDKGAKEDA